MSNIRRTLFVASLSTFLGCNSSSEVDSLNARNLKQDSGVTASSNRDSGQTPADAGFDSFDGGLADASVTMPPQDCSEACAVRNMFSEACFTYEACIETCNEASTWSSNAQDGFYACIANETLCVELLDQCILRLGHPDPVSVSTSFVLRRCDDFDGRRVYAVLDPGRTDALAESIITNGQTELIWEVDMQIGGLDRPLLYYIDVDNDGQCDPEVDITQNGEVQWRGDFETFIFEGSGACAPSLPSARSICRVLND